MKKFTKSLFICLLAFFCIVGLTGCKSKKELADAKETITTLQAQLAAYEKEKAELSDKLTKLETQASTDAAALETAKTEKAALEASIVTLEARIAELENDETIPNLEAQVALLEAEKAALETKTAALDEAVAELEANVEALEQLVTDSVGLVLELQALNDPALKADAEAYAAAFTAAFTKVAATNGFGYTLDVTNADEVFGPAFKGVYFLNVGKQYELQLQATTSYYIGEDNVLELTFDVPADTWVYDYLSDATYDYNRGVVSDAGKLEFALKGDYYLGIILKTDFANYVPFETLDSENFDKEAFQASDNYMAAYNMAAFGVGNGGVYVVSVAEPVQVGFGDYFDRTVECKPADELQVVLEEGAQILSAVSSDDAVATVDTTGKVVAVGKGTATLTVNVKNAAGVEYTVALSVTVVVKQDADKTAGGADGAWYDFKYASVETQSKILAYLERALINAGASIPVYNNSGLIIYSERVNFITDDYIAGMGYGPTSVAPDTGKGAGTEADPAYRMWTSADPSTLNHLNYADSIESDFLSMTAGQLIAFDWKLDENGKGIGWEIKPEMLSVLPYPVEKTADGSWTKVENFSGLDQYTTWKFDLRTDLKWENGDAMNANDFIYTYKLVLDPKLNMKRANYFYGGGAPIKGAEAYFKGQTTDWETVGIKQVDDYSFVFEYKDALKLWDVEYNMSGFLYTPVHKATWEANIAADGTPQYGSSNENYMASGAYKISYWEKGKEYRFTKNENYFVWEGEDVQVMRPAYENYSFVIVKDNNAALQLFKEGLLDVTSVPASAYDDFKDWPSQKFSPGATSFRLSVNRMTQAELDAEFGTGAWEAKPILQEDDFMWALYFGLDRLGVQDITKTSTAWASYFTNAYEIVSPTIDGVESKTYRETEWGKKVYEGLDGLDYNLAKDSLGYLPAFAKENYIAALESMEAKGVFSKDAPYTVEIEIAAFDGTTNEAVYAYVAQKYNELFNSDEVKAVYPNVTFKATFAPQPGMDVYYVKQMTGQYDLALAGISGETMRPAGFMECFCDDNRSGLLLSLGFDSHNANILIDLDVDGDGVNDGEKYWSFDALYSALMGNTFVKEGVEAKASAEETAE